jgi:hypothetical protein
LGWKFARNFKQKDGLNVVHYLEPRITLVNRDVSLSPEKLFQYDDLDQIQSDQLLSLQLLNRLEFNRPNRSFEALRFNLEADYSIKKNRFGDLRSLLVFDPDKNLTFRSEGDFDLDAGKWKTLTTSFDWSKDDFRFRLNYGYQGGTDEVVTPRISLPLGKKWRIDTYADYDLKKDNFEGREISIWRDLHCWEGRLGLYQDRRETEIYLVFTLKGFSEDAIKINSRLY